MNPIGEPNNNDHVKVNRRRASQPNTIIGLVKTEKKVPVTSRSAAAAANIVSDCAEDPE
jgi:hypothetical protein